jgi:hypothetical protein
MTHVFDSESVFIWVDDFLGGSFTTTFSFFMYGYHIADILYAVKFTNITLKNL